MRKAIAVAGYLKKVCCLNHGRAQTYARAFSLFFLYFFLSVFSPLPPSQIFFPHPLLSELGGFPHTYSGNGGSLGKVGDGLKTRK